MLGEKSESLNARTKDQILFLKSFIMLSDEEPWLNDTTGCTFPSPWDDTFLSEENRNNEQQSGMTSSGLEVRNEDFVGSYEHPGFGVYSVFEDSDYQLRFEFGTLLRGPLTATSNDSDTLYMTFDPPLDYITTKNRDSYPSGYPAYFTRSQLTSQVESVVIPYFEFLLPPRFNKM